MEDRYLEIEPPRASLGQLRLTNKLEMIPVENDVLGVVERLKHIDPGLFMLYDLQQDIYVLWWKGLNEQGHLIEQLVGAYKELDQRIVNLIERIDGQGRSRHDLSAELDRLERERDAEHEHERLERVGPLGEELQFALRKDLGMTSQAHMSGSREKFRRKKRRR